MYVYRGIVFKLLPFARFVDFLLLRLASKTEMKCNSYNARNAISNVQEVSRVLFLQNVANMHVGTLLRGREPTFPVAFPSSVIFPPNYFVPSFPESNYFFCFIKILQVFNYLVRISLHASFHPIKFRVNLFFFFFHKYKYGLDQFISSISSTIKSVVSLKSSHEKKFSPLQNH